MAVGLVLFLLILLLFLGMPVGFALGVSGLTGLLLEGGTNIFTSILSTVPYRSVANYSLATVPLFIFMAEVIAKANIVGDIFKIIQKWVGSIPGGLAITTVIASAGMGAMSGSSTASAACMSSLAVPEMCRAGYKLPVAAGVVTVAGTLAIMIPPSIPLVIYGIVTETSIGKLLIAGIIPGLMTTLIYSTGILAWGKIDKGSMPKSQSYTWKEKFEGIQDLWPFLVLVTLVIGSMYTGLATATEAAAVGAAGAVVISLIIRRINARGIFEAAMRTVKTTTMIFTIIIGAMIFGYFFTMTQVAQKLISFIAASGIPNLLIILILVVFYLILGCMLDVIAILLLTLPLTFPLVTSMGYDPIWFGIIVTKLCEIGLVTPPVGMNAYVVSGTINAPLELVFKGTGVMLSFEAVTLILLLCFPIISTWLPSFMK